VDADCIKLTSYLGGRHQAGGRSAGDALIDLYRQHDIAAIIVLRGMHGSGLRGDSVPGQTSRRYSTGPCSWMFPASSPSNTHGS
jgi:PII-like signaling protein